MISVGLSLSKLNTRPERNKTGSTKGVTVGLSNLTHPSSIALALVSFWLRGDLKTVRYEDGEV